MENTNERKDIIREIFHLLVGLAVCVFLLVFFCVMISNCWTCSCGNENIGKFCTECGAEKSEAKVAARWTCSCGNVNKGKFCSECGAENPADVLVDKCDNCGWEPDATKNPPKLCPKCGEPYTESITPLP